MPRLPRLPLRLHLRLRRCVAVCGALARAREGADAVLGTLGRTRAAEVVDYEAAVGTGDEGDAARLCAAEVGSELGVLLVEGEEQSLEVVRGRGKVINARGCVGEEASRGRFGEGAALAERDVGARLEVEHLCAVLGEERDGLAGREGAAEEDEWVGGRHGWIGVGFEKSL